jgi:hypothetical protein
VKAEIVADGLHRLPQGPVNEGVVAFALEKPRLFKTMVRFAIDKG